MKQILDDGNKLPICDPTPHGQFKLLKTEGNKENVLPSTSQLYKNSDFSLRMIAAEIPKEQWNKSLEHLPDLTDINIREYLTQSGKRVKRDQSVVPNQVSKQTAQRPERRGYQFFVEKYIHGMSTAYYKCQLFVKSKCFRSQKKSEEPHSLIVAITISPCKVYDAYCSCVAGASGFCNHVFGVLYTLSHYAKSGIKEIPSDLSRTSQPQQWDKPRIAGIRAEPMMEIEIRKATNVKSGIKSSLYEARVQGQEAIDIDRLDQVKKQMRTENPLYGICYMPSEINASTEYVKTSLGVYVPKGSPLSYQLSLSEGDFDVSCNIKTDLAKCDSDCNTSVFPDLPIGEYQPFRSDNIDPQFKNFISKLEFCYGLEKETRSQTNSELWWKARRFRLTASKFGEIAKRKTNEHQKFIDRLTEKSNELNLPASLKYGRENESVAIEKYCKYMANIGHKVTVLPCGLVVRPDLPFLGGSPDGKIIDPVAHPHYGILEVKCPYKYREVSPMDAALMDSDFYVSVKDEKLYLKETHQYYFQVQGQLALTGAKWCDFVIYTKKGLGIQRIKFNEQFWLDTYLKLEIFYFTHFLPHVIKRQQTLPGIE